MLFQFLVLLPKPAAIELVGKREGFMLVTLVRQIRSNQLSTNYNTYGQFCNNLAA